MIQSSKIDVYLEIGKKKPSPARSTGQAGAGADAIDEPPAGRYGESYLPAGNLSKDLQL